MQYPSLGDPTSLNLPGHFDEPHREWRATMRRFCEETVAPGAAARDRDETFDPALVTAMGEVGILGLLIPRAYGGSARDLTTFCIAIEELARVDSSAAATAHVQTISTALLAELADDDRKAALLPDLARGKALISFGLTEPSSGSDAQNVSTVARRDGDGWILNGEKAFITNAGTTLSRHVIAIARTGTTDAGKPEISAFLVPVDSEGFVAGPRYRKLGWRATDTRPLRFVDLALPADALLGEVGKGFHRAMRFLEWIRIGIAAMSTGLAQGCLEAAFDFTRTRHSFGAAVASRQSVAFDLADMLAMTETARLLTYDAARRYDNGQPIGRAASVAKLTASEHANRIAYMANHLHGALGCDDDSFVARAFRDARVLTVGEGTSEIQRIILARSMGLAA